MKATKAFVFLAIGLMMACKGSIGGKPEEVVENPITITSPEPTEQIKKVSLSEQQQGYVQAGNQMAFRLLQKLYEGESLICSPLSLQYALAMAANGASGETLQEITDFLGYGDEGIDALNAFSKAMLDQLPAVDLNVKLKLTDAILVNANKYTLQPAYKQIVESNYYAAVENEPFDSPAQIAARINEWARRNTYGFIDKVIDPKDIDPEAAAFLMNALYFKARWAGKYNPMFLKELTKDEKFTRANGSVIKVPTMRTSGFFDYAEMDGFKVLALPYADRKFHMYFLLPDDKDPAGMLNRLQGISWDTIMGNLRQDAEVIVRIPRFDLENKFKLKDTLKAMGVRTAFDRESAVFDRMLDPYRYFYIGSVIQKAKISVAEWGTEAAAVTVVEVDGATSGPPGEEPKVVYFYADHPFAFFIGEATSKTILFEGIYSGK